MGEIWRIALYQPIFNLLVVIYNVVPDMGAAIVLLTLVFKGVMHPLSHKALRGQRALQELQPKVDELRAKYKDQKDAMAKELMALYQKEKVSPFSSCLPLLVQLPFLIALYKVFGSGLASHNLDLLYSFVPNPGQISDISMGFWNLSHPSWVLAFITGAAQYWQSKMLVHKKPPVAAVGSKDENMAAMMNKQMLYMMPALTVIFGFKLPAGLVLYWLVNIIYTVAQQHFAFRHHEPKATT